MVTWLSKYGGHVLFWACTAAAVGFAFASLRAHDEQANTYLLCVAICGGAALVVAVGEHPES